MSDLRKHHVVVAAIVERFGKFLLVEEIRADRNRHRSPLVLGCIDDSICGRRFPIDVLRDGGP